jgi:colanic acid/amylovoran biosynthesis glycosyltransferase
VPRIVYVTARLPYGDGEPFVATEVQAIERLGWDVTVVPVRAGGEIVHREAAALETEAAPLVSASIAGRAFSEAARKPRATGAVLSALARGRSASIFAKNAAVFPKGAWLARLVERTGAVHIHAHWAGTTATMAMAASRLTGVPWSLTAHRWDIAENNLLRVKAREASFFRVISEHGARELEGLVGQPGWRPWVLHMGVELPLISVPAVRRTPLRVLVAARLVEKKGHADLIKAASILRSRGSAIHVDLAGGGPLEADLRRQVGDSGLAGEVNFLGAVSHDDLLARLAAGDWDVAALPSVVTASGELEGIPVSLVEAMAHGLPALATATGAIPELLDDGAGLLVPPADPGALADALEQLAGDPDLRTRLGTAGRLRIEEQYDVDRVAEQLGARFAETG